MSWRAAGEGRLETQRGSVRTCSESREVKDGFDISAGSEV